MDTRLWRVAESTVLDSIEGRITCRDNSYTGKTITYVVKLRLIDRLRKITLLDKMKRKIDTLTWRAACLNTKALKQAQTQNSVSNYVTTIRTKEFL